MNNRPITYQGEDVQRAPTPSDLINGQTLPQIAEELVENDHQESNNVTKRYGTDGIVNMSLRSDSTTKGTKTKEGK